MSLILNELALIIKDAEQAKERKRIAEQIRIERKAYEDIKGLISEVKELTNGRSVYKDMSQDA
jgi:hypothetical protein